jgi:hypothetical protein
LVQTKKPIDDKELYIEIVVSKGLGRLTPRAKELLIKLASNAIRKKQYYAEEDRDDCRQTGLLVMFMNWHNFNPEKFSNAFAYFTEIFKRGIAQGLKECHGKRGEDKDYKVRTVSINSANQGQGMFNL